MSKTELQNFIHVFSMFSFSDGHSESGIIVNKYNVPEAKLEYYFVRHSDMNTYRSAHEKNDNMTCNQLSTKINPEDIVDVSTVSLGDFKTLMQTLNVSSPQRG